ncbi:MAG: pro-sigmaK processing inhibitor BofA family protein [Lachnospiraceae bacterium]|nr:pro-sigmaK processing inhibitor BofA family protein [Lachnospiraceae bacterium]
MNDYMGEMMIAVSCVIVLLMGCFKRKKEWIINFVFRMVTGTLSVFFVNGFLVSQGISIAIGINLITIFIAGLLGFPGLIMLYCINLYKIL